MKNYIVFIFLILTQNLFANTYYLDATNGSNYADGLSEKQAWKSLSKINEIKLKAGDKVLLKRGEIFSGELYIHGKGKKGNPIIISGYGKAATAPCIRANENSLYALCIYNSEYIKVQNIELVNKSKDRIPGKSGLKVHLNNYGIAHSIELRNLYIHDVNGSLVKKEGGGAGIYIINEGTKLKSAYDGLLIEDCIISKCDRNGIIWKGYSDRSDWFPNRNIVIRKNLLDQIPGDGIVPIGCVNTLIEYNKMQNSPALLPSTEAAAGIWPWSCDSTLIQYNEVCDHKAPWDGQGFDSDDNCTNTTFQYNYSHNNEGGFMLICHDGTARKESNCGNIGTVIKYNISINDATRKHYTTRAGYFSPTIHISGPCVNTLIYRNILHINKKQNANMDRRVIVSDDYGGYSDQMFLKENLLFTAEPSAFDLRKSTNDIFESNYYIGAFSNIPFDKKEKRDLESYQKHTETDSDGFHFLSNFMKVSKIANQTIELQHIDKYAIKLFFDTVQ